MSRVHDALRRAEQAGLNPPEPDTVPAVAPVAAVESARTSVATAASTPTRSAANFSGGLALGPEFLSSVARVPFSPSPDSHLIDMSKPHEAPAEEFRTLRTRVNHLQTLQPIHTLVVTSPSPAEGKSFAAVNLALAEAAVGSKSNIARRLRFPPSDRP